MNYLRCIIPGMASIIIAITSPTFATTNGQDDRVQWNKLSDLQLPDKPLDIAYSLDGNHAFILTKSNQVLVYNQQGVLQGRIAVEGGVSAIDISPRGEFLYLIDGQDNRLSTLAVDFIVDIDTSYSPIRGAANAPVTLVVYSDFE